MVRLVSLTIPDRYCHHDHAIQRGVAGLPGLVKLAWDIALLFPECGDEILADLIADVRGIAERTEVEVAEARLTAERADEAYKDAHQRAERRLRRTREAVASEFAGMNASDLSKGIDPRGFYVYLLWGEDPERPIYVGQSTNLLSRLGQHMTDAAKRDMTRRVTVVRCEDRAEMDRTEDRLIQCYQPVLNIRGVIDVAPEAVRRGWRAAPQPNAGQASPSLPAGAVSPLAAPRPGSGRGSAPVPSAGT